MYNQPIKKFIKLTETLKSPRSHTLWCATFTVARGHGVAPRYRGEHGISCLITNLDTVPAIRAAEVVWWLTSAIHVETCNLGHDRHIT